MLLLLKNLLFTILAPGTVAVFLPQYIAGDKSPASGGLRALALILVGIGRLIYACCVWDCVSHGKGMPAQIDAPKQLVIQGLYRLTRNPMYLSVLTVILGWTALY